MLGDKITVSESRLYRLIEYAGLTSGGTVELTVPNGMGLNAFTFGS